jgi:hypothetical protein
MGKGWACTRRQVGGGRTWKGVRGNHRAPLWNPEKNGDDCGDPVWELPRVAIISPWGYADQPGARALAWRSGREIPGDIDDHDPLPTAHQQHCLEHLRPLVVQQVVVPAMLEDLGNDDGELAIGVIVL